MKDLFKRFGRGFLFILVLPFWVVVFVLFTIYAVFSFLYTLISTIPLFFKGESVLGPSELDIAASTKLAKQKELDSLPDSSPFIQPVPTQPTIVVNVQTPPVVAPRTDPSNLIEQNGVIYRRLTSEEIQEIAMKKGEDE